MVGIDATVNADVRGLSKALERWAAKQLPFATAKALTLTARDARDRVRGDLSKSFTLRGKRVERGIRFERAEKRDWPRPRARVGTVDEYMVDHALGGIRRGKGGRRAVPTRAIRRSKTGKIPKSQRPRAIREKKSTFLEGDQIRRRRGRGRSSASRLTMLYLLRNAVRIQKTWPIRKQVESEVRVVYLRHFVRELASASKSRR